MRASASPQAPVGTQASQPHDWGNHLMVTVREPSIQSLTAMKVLVVDDNAQARDILQATLVGQGHDVLEAATGAAALSMAERERPEVVLLDVMMPDLSGFEVCRRLRESDATRETAVIMVTALNDREARLQGFEAGADDFIVKPIDRTELRIRLRTLARLTRFQRLIAERHRYNTLARMSPDAILSIDPHGRVRFGNPKADELLAPLDTRGISTLASPATANLLHNAWFSVATGAAPLRRAHVDLVGPDGTFTAEVSFGSKDAFGGTILLIRDLSERIRLETRVLHLERLEAIASMSSGVAHDFANALIAVKRAIASAREDLEHGAAADGPLEDAGQLIDQTTDLVRQMNRLGAPHEWTPRTVDPDAQIRAMAPLLRHLTDGARVDFELQDAPTEVRVDPLDLKQILMNLTSNAIRAVGADGAITIRSFRGATPKGADPAHDWWYVHVEDDGIGMPAEVARQAFDPYFTTHEASGGSGLGLPTVRTLVVRNRGRVRLDTGEGTGTTVSVGFHVVTSATDTVQEPGADADLRRDR